ncbi:Uncharacterised protein r2_g3187 [Pycnogonum litorale]
MSFFKIPNKNKHPEWHNNTIQIVCRTRDPKNFNKDKAFICSRHFEEDDTTTDKLGHRRLKSGALPTRNLPTKSVVYATSSRRPPQPRSSPELPERVTHFGLSDIATAVNKIEEWKCYESHERFLILRHQTESKWTIYLSIFADFSVTISIDGHKLPEKHELYGIIDIEHDKLCNSLQAITSFSPCVGASCNVNFANTLSFIHTAMPVSKLIDKEDKNVSCVRSKKCFGLVKGFNCCKECLSVEQLTRQPISILKSKANFCKASSAQLTATIKHTRNVLKESENKIDVLIKEVNDIGNMVDSKMASTFENILENQGNEFSKLFFKEQKRRWDGKSGKWHPMLIRYALLLHSRSPSAYNLLRDTGVLHLPSDRTLRDYSQAIKSRCGLQNEKIIELKENTKHLYGHQRYISLVFDEMKISEGLVYRNNEIVGFVDLGNEDLNATVPQHQSTLASHVLALHVIGLSTLIKYPISYYAVKILNRTLLFPIIWEAIAALEIHCDLKVLTCVCDGASSNRSFFAMHGTETTYKCINIFSADKRQLYFISDAPHLLKTLRNNISNSGSHSKTKFLLNNGKFILWAHIKAIYDEDQKRELKLLSKLKEEHIHLNPYNKMRVNLAAQILSSSVGNIMMAYGHQDYSETARFILLCDRFFDCLNTRSLTEAQFKRKPYLKPYTDVNDPRFEFLIKEFIGYFEKWYESIPPNSEGADKKFISKQTYTGLKITCNSIVEVIKYLLTVAKNALYPDQQIHTRCIRKPLWASPNFWKKIRQSHC